MNHDITDMVFIIDRSGSMEGLEKETVQGFNSMLNKQMESVNVTTVLFDDEVEELYYRKKLCDVREMTENEFFVRGCTALLDAMGRTIYKMIVSQRKDKSKPDKIIFVIITDGLENASREYTYGSVKKLIQKQKGMGWEFFFLGANMDAVREAADIGISSDRSVTFYNDSAGVALNYEVIGKTLHTMRMESSEQKKLDASWKNDIEVYYRKIKHNVLS